MKLIDPEDKDALIEELFNRTEIIKEEIQNLQRALESHAYHITELKGLLEGQAVSDEELIRHIWN